MFHLTYMVAAAKPPEGVYFVEWYAHLILYRPPVGVANLATRRRMVLCGTLDGTSSRNCLLASPGGKLSR